MLEVADSTIGTHKFVESRETSDKLCHCYDTSLESLDDSLEQSNVVFSCVMLADKRWGAMTTRGAVPAMFNTLERYPVRHIHLRLNHFSWTRHLQVQPVPLTPDTTVSF